MRRSKNRTRRGGGATVMPLKYYDPSAQEPAASSGHDLLKAIPPIGVRPKIGGKRRKHRTHHRRRTVRGGFVPSIMDGFVAAASKYIVPIALFAGYKMMTRKGSKRRHTRRK